MYCFDKTIITRPVGFFHPAWSRNLKCINICLLLQLTIFQPGWLGKTRRVCVITSRVYIMTRPVGFFHPAGSKTLNWFSILSIPLRLKPFIKPYKAMKNIFSLWLFLFWADNSRFPFIVILYQLFFVIIIRGLSSSASVYKQKISSYFNKLTLQSRPLVPVVLSGGFTPERSKNTSRLSWICILWV